jgi:hypothetical protein
MKDFPTAAPKRVEAASCRFTEMRLEAASTPAQVGLVGSSSGTYKLDPDFVAGRT